ncbi:hypothetical protein [Candidatus Magnetominusculus dajiuhuensis]|uniref:LPD3 domain-containing protein n=1 Tax=Candidatus Magnetominusculus dajiuhuensis TaxID=3137712 RepID=UPI003B431719
MKVTKLDGKMFGDEIWEARKKAYKWAGENIQGKSLVNKDTGWGIDITGKGIKKVLSGERLVPIDHIETVRAIPEMIENAVKVESRPDRDNNPHIKNIHIFCAPLEIDNRLYRVTLTVKETKYGRRYYDHRLTEIEKPAAGRALHTGDTLSGSASRMEQQAYTASLEDLLKNVKTSKDN